MHLLVTHTLTKWASGSRVTVFLCIQIAIDKMKLCSLSVAYACPYHNPTAPMGHCSQRHQKTTRPHNAIHVVCGCEAKFSNMTLEVAYGREINC